MKDDILTDELDVDLQSFLYKKYEINVNTVKDAMLNSKLDNIIWIGIENANMKAISKAQTIKK